MNTSKKFIIMIFIFLMLFFTQNLIFAANDYPNKPIIGIVSSLGGSVETTLRMIQPYLEEELGVPIVVEAHEGAGTEVANTVLYRESSDGYTFATNNWEYMVITTILRDPVYSYDDFVYLCIQAKDPRILLVKKDSPFNTLDDIVKYCKENPGKLAFSASQGGNQHLILLVLRDILNIDFKVVGYKGGRASRTAMLGGHTDGAMGETTGAYYLREDTKCVILFDDKPNKLWPEGIPYTKQLEPYGVTMPDLARYDIYMVKREFKEKYPERFNILKNAFLNASKNPGYLEAAKKYGLDRIMLWQDADNFEKQFQDMYDFFVKTKDLWKEME